MRVKFLADVNFDRRIVDGVLRRESLVDFQTSEEAELSGKSDLEVLEIAASLQRVLVTHDRKTMPKAFGAFASHSESFGVLVISQNWIYGPGLTNCSSFGRFRMPKTG
jgi:hypothetical protein